MKPLLQKITLFVFLHFWPIISIYAQTNPNISQFKLVLKKACFYKENNFDSAYYYLNKGDILSRKFPLSKERYQYFWTLGDYYKFNKNFDEAEKAYNEMFRVASQLKLETNLNTSLFSIAALKTEKGEFLEAARSYFLLEDLLIKGLKKKTDSVTNLGQRSLLLAVYNDLALIFKKLEEKERNADYLKKMEPLLKSKGDSLFFIFALSNNSLDKNHHIYYKPALYLATALKDTLAIKEIYSEIGHWYIKKGDYHKAVENAKMSIGIKLKTNYKWKYDLINYYTLGLYHLNLGESDKAKYFLNKALNGFKKNMQLDYQIKVLFDLSKLYQKEGNFHEALNSFVLGQSIKDSLKSSEKMKNISQLDIDFQESLHKKQIAADRTLKNFLLLLLFCALFFMALLLHNFVQKIILIKKLEESKNKLSQQTKLLTDANDTKDRLFAIISHDLRGPINNLVAFIYLLEDNFTPPKEYLSKLRFKTENVQVVLENLFNWAEKRIKNAPLNVSKINFDIILKKVLKQFEDTILEKKIEIETYNNEMEIYSDENYFHIILRNIISNAVKFTEPKGRIKIGYSRTGTESIISILDSGEGIAPKQIRELLNSPDSKDGKSQVKGLGMGLLLCKELMEKQGGNLSISSDNGNGTEVRLKFPLIRNVRKKQ